MKFNEVIIKTDSAGAEQLSGLLIINGITAFSVDDPGDFLEIIKEKAVPFDYYEESLIPADPSVVTITVYLPQNDQGEERAAFLLAEADKMKESGLYGKMSVSFATADDKDWENNWKEFFHPLPVGDKIIIRPSWEECDAEGRTVIQIDPESSFGSGRHETTKLCLELLEKQSLCDSDVLDMGCGSGILGIAACLLGAKRAVCVDIEENAVEITRKNADINEVGERVEAHVGNILENNELAGLVAEHKYGVIVANIVADVLVQMMPFFSSVVTSDGHLILSGIITLRREQIEASLAANGFRTLNVLCENDWLGIEAVKL